MATPSDGVGQQEEERWRQRSPRPESRDRDRSPDPERNQSPDRGPDRNPDSPDPDDPSQDGVKKKDAPPGRLQKLRKAVRPQAEKAMKAAKGHKRRTSGALIGAIMVIAALALFAPALLPWAMLGGGAALLYKSLKGRGNAIQPAGTRQGGPGPLPRPGAAQQPDQTQSREANQATAAALQAFAVAKIHGMPDGQPRISEVQRQRPVPSDSPEPSLLRQEQATPEFAFQDDGTFKRVAALPSLGYGGDPRTAGFDSGRSSPAESDLLYRDRSPSPSDALRSYSSEPPQSPVRDPTQYLPSGTGRDQQNNRTSREQSNPQQVRSASPAPTVRAQSRGRK